MTLDSPGDGTRGHELQLMDIPNGYPLNDSGRPGGGTEFNISHVGGHLPDATTYQRGSLEVEGFEDVAPVPRDDAWITRRTYLEWEHGLRDASTESKTAEPSQGSDTLISEPHSRSSDAEMSSQDENQSSPHGPIDLSNHEARLSGFGDRPPVPEPDPAYATVQTHVLSRHPGDSQAVVHTLPAQNQNRLPNQVQSPYQTQEPDPDPDPSPAPVVAAGIAKAFLKTNPYLNLLVITIIPLCIAIAVGLRTNNLSTSAVVGTCIWTPLLVMYGVLLLVWRSQEKAQEHQTRRMMEAAAEEEGRAIDPGAMA